MQPLEFLVPLDALEAVSGLLPHAVLVFLLANLATRHLAHQQQAEEAAESDSVSHYPPHLASSLLLVLASFAFLLVEPHGGMVMTALVMGVVVSDFFEFEARNVEARNDLDFEKPKAAITASLLALLYALYQSLFFIVQPYWDAIV